MTAPKHPVPIASSSPTEAPPLDRHPSHHWVFVLFLLPFALLAGRHWNFDPAIGSGDYAQYLAHARAIAASADAFRSKVRELLVAESKRVGDGRASEEILALEIENVCLWESGPPVTGMIYFLGGDDDRVWRCDYEDGEPKDLGFDS